MKLSLRWEKPVYFVGETIAGHLVIENSGGPSFDFTSGGDYRGYRPTRFSVQCVGPDGKTTADPDTLGYSFGGLSGGGSLAGGEKKELNFPLLRYCLIDKPGKYRITVSHDLGWKDTDARPSATSELSFRVPSQKEADDIVSQMIGAIARSRNHVHITAVDVEALRYSAYLKPLIRFAQGGSLDAVDGIASIQTPSATKALIDLLQTVKDEQADRVMAYLSERVPLPEIPPHDRLTSPGGPHIDAHPEIRRDMVRKAWRPEFAQQLRSIVMQVPKPTSNPWTTRYWLEQRAPILVVAVLKPEDEAYLADQITMKLASNEHGERPCRTWQGWRDAGTIWVARNLHVSENPQSLGEKALFLLSFRDRPEFRSHDRLDKVLQLVNDPHPALRELAMWALPIPIPENAYPSLAKRLKDTDDDVVIAAASIAKRDKIAAVASAMLAAVDGAQEQWGQDAILYALNDVQPPLKAAETYAKLMQSKTESVRRGAFNKLIYFLISRKKTGGYPAAQKISVDQGNVLSKRWLTFLRTYAKEVAAGQKFEPGEAPLTEDLFPNDLYFQFMDGGRWPNGRARYWKGEIGD